MAEAGEGWLETVDAPHRCSPPPVRTFGSAPPAKDPRNRIPSVKTLAEGTRYWCPCGVVWVVRLHGEVVGPRVHYVARHGWVRETRRERRRRTGVPWWRPWS